MAKNEITIDELARMVARGFDEMGQRLTKLETSLDQFRDENAREHLEIKLRLDNVPYRFELKDLTDRVEKLEKKAKFA